MNEEIKKMNDCYAKACEKTARIFLKEKIERLKKQGADKNRIKKLEEKLIRI